MRNHTVLLTLFASLTASSCKQIECGEGTIERDGSCAPASTTTNNSLCGPFTELRGDRCEPQFPPTECDPATTQAMVDPDTGVTICIGTGGGGCGAPLACPTPSGTTKLTICGQLYDFENNTKFANSVATGARCGTTPASSGPCALQILAFDAISFGQNPQTATPLQVGDVYIDDCGRYLVSEIETNGTGPFIGLGIDDAGQPLGPNGVTVTVGVATPKPSTRVVADFEAWIVNASTTQLWENSGGPSLAGGVFAALYRQHKLGNGDRLAPQAGVTITKSSAPQPANDFYFSAGETSRQTIDGNAVATGANGTGLLTNASVADSIVYSGQGGLGTGCSWEPHAAASLPGIVFIQVFRKLDISGMTCND